MSSFEEFATPGRELENARRCIFCYVADTSMVVPIEPFMLNVLGQVGQVPIQAEELPVCRECARFIDAKYFDRVARRAATERRRYYQEVEGQQVIGQNTSVAFFRNFMGQFAPWIKGPSYPNPKASSQTGEEPDARS